MYDHRSTLNAPMPTAIVSHPNTESQWMQKSISEKFNEKYVKSVLRWIDGINFAVKVSSWMSFGQVGPSNLNAILTRSFSEIIVYSTQRTPHAECVEWMENICDMIWSLDVTVVAMIGRRSMWRNSIEIRHSFVVSVVSLLWNVMAHLICLANVQRARNCTQTSGHTNRQMFNSQFSINQ